MKVIKLRTVKSTNTYLKNMLRKEIPENFTTVVAYEQTQGRGHRGNKWHSAAGKNLTFSLFCKFNSFLVTRQFEINQAVSLGLLQCLKKYFPKVSIKWPNDIMAEDSKIAGILIENTVSNKILKYSIIGVGINVNQILFPSFLPNATSLKSLLNKEIDLSVLLSEIIALIKKYLKYIEDRKELLQKKYVENLFLWRQEACFSDNKNREFTGKIIGLSKEGKLQIAVNDKIKEFGFKEVQFLEQ